MQLTFLLFPMSYLMLKKIVLFVILIFKTQGVVGSSSINTIPTLHDHVLVTSFSGFIVKAQFEREDKMNRCYWNLTTSQIIIRTPSDGCLQDNSTDAISTCEERNGTIFSNLTFKQPITSNVDVNVFCFFNSSGRTIQHYQIIIQDCPTSLNASLTVKLQRNATYNQAGVFECSNNGHLFHNNGTMASNQTTCLAQAKWKNQDTVQCWSAPNVTIQDSLNVLEGNNLNITCKYDDVIPPGNESIYYFNGSVTTKLKNQSFIIKSLKPTDNQKTISCQAVTPFTKMTEFNGTGRSPQNKINVLYIPYQTSPTTCTSYINQSHLLCNITFFSSPKATFLALMRNGIVRNDLGVLINGSLDEQVFQIRKNSVTKEYGGNYTLHIRSSLPPYNHTINFTIAVADIPSSVPATLPPTRNNTSWLIPVIVVLSVLLLLLLIAAAVVIKRKRLVKAGAVQVSQTVGVHERKTPQIQQRETRKPEPNYIDMKNISPIQENPVRGFHQEAGVGISVSHLEHSSYQRKPADYVNLEDNVEVSVDHDGYLSLRALSPEDDVKSADYINIQQKKPSDYVDMKNLSTENQDESSQRTYENILRLGFNEPIANTSGESTSSEYEDIGQQTTSVE